MINDGTVNSRRVIPDQHSDDRVSLVDRQRSVLIALGWIIVLVVCGSSTASAQIDITAVPTAYTVQDLGPLPTIAADVAPGINGNGDVCLWSSAGAGVHASLWRQSGAVDLGVAHGYLNSIARGINQSDHVVGWMNTSQNPVDSRSTTRAFLYDGKTLQVLPTLGGKFAQAFGLNDHGQVVGISSLADGSRHAFVSDGRKATDLPPLPGQKYSAAFAINTAGDIAGVSEAPNGTKHAVIWRQGKPIDLGTLPGGRDSCAYTMADNGDACGYSETSDGYHAFLYKNGTMVDLGTLGSDPSVAMGVNSLGLVVGASNLARFGRHGFVWARGKMVDLNALVDKSSGWTITGAYSINESGNIVCVGQSAKTQGDHALLLRPVFMFGVVVF